MLFAKELNSNFEEIKQYMSVSVASDFDKLSPHIDDAETKHIKKLLGPTLYNKLCTYYENTYLTSSNSASVVESNSGSVVESWDNFDSLLKRIQKALINLAFFEGFAELSISADSTGFHRIESEKKKSLYSYQEKRLEESYKRKGFNALDEAIEFIESKISSFGEFKESDTYKEMKSSFVKSASEFNTFYGINNSRLVFLKLKPFMKRALDLYVTPEVGYDLMNELKEKLEGNEDPDENYQIIIDAIKPIIVFKAVADGIRETNVNVTDSAIFYSGTNVTMNNARVEEALKSEELSFIVANADKTSLSYLELLRSELVKQGFKDTTIEGRSIRNFDSSKKTARL